MALPVDVSDPDDPRLADFRDLTDADVRPDRRGVVIAEGVAVVERLLTSRYRPRAVFGEATRLAALADTLAGFPDLPVYCADRWLLSDVIGFRLTRGILASANRLPPAPVPDLLARAGRVAVLESLNDFENLGALFRNAAAFGLDAVLLDEQCADPLYRRSVRVSMGHVLHVPFAVVPGSWPAALATLRESGFTLLALTPSAEATPLASVAPPDRWAVLLGAEGPGLTARGHGGRRRPRSHPDGAGRRLAQRGHGRRGGVRAPHRRDRTAPRAATRRLTRAHGTHG